MRLHAILSVAAVTALSTSLAAGNPVLAATSMARPAAGVPAKAGVLGKVTVNTALGFGRAADAQSARDKAAHPDQEEFFFCDPITYGILGITPVIGSDGEVTGYLAPYVLAEQCPLPMAMQAGITIYDNTANRIQDSAQGVTPFGEDVDAEGDTELPVNSNFLGTYILQMVLLPGFEWIVAPPQCVGIGTISLTCTFLQTATTPGSGS
jgi:hypothetical protein